MLSSVGCNGNKPVWVEEDVMSWCTPNVQNELLPQCITAFVVTFIGGYLV
ncbi:hypothetical protein TOL_3639 [Thalassolituus oleivorans MIL-1]|uniref:Uncharacterized protein n=1 Tax=Thalassolituus oleivorans MIL-1 TaxID=1298593 RepID=M5DW11_9GAMM|nr:hypothetical protein TOL_3639 [Thalassolituus oleivorans MIL-1]